MSNATASTFNLGLLNQIRATFEAMPPVCCGFVVKPEMESAIKRDTRFKETRLLSPFVGMEVGLPIYPQKQIINCWAFFDQKLMRQYLAGVVAETDLFNYDAKKVRMLE